MASQLPNDDDIENLMACAPSMGRTEAVARLRGNNNNIEQALNEYFDSPDSVNKYRYDESQFHADRDGIHNNPAVSFQVHSTDELAPIGSMRYDGSMSRPPSRTNNKSPLSSVVDLTGDNANDSKNLMFYGDDGDRDLQEAIAASRADVGLPPQATGTTNAAQVHFGPANRGEYEPGQWDMVPLGISSREILLDPEPADRKRDIDVPAFLKPSVADHRLGALLTMYHEIPEVREVFLDRGRILDKLQYGHNPEWWNGSDIEISDSRGAMINAEVAAEFQRLMAFLDKTDRTYGSVESLANMKDVKNARRRHNYLEAAAMAAWKDDSTHNVGGVMTIFSKGVQSEADEDGDGEEFAILELTYPSKDSAHETIYDIADEVLWPVNTEMTESSYLAHIADVIVFKLGADSIHHKKVDIPAVWYPDRYLKGNRAAAWQMRMNKWEVSKELERIAGLEERLTNFPARNGKIFKVRDLLAASLRHDEAQVDDTAHDLDQMDGMSFQGSAKTAKLSAQLQALVASIERKLAALAEERERAILSMRELSQLYTKQSDDPNEPKLSKYLLRGVSTTKDITYICRRPEPDLIEMELDDGEPKKKGDQWWKIAYVSEGYNARTSVSKITEEAVLEAAKNEGSNVLLVYAHEGALDVSVVPLPAPLEFFVQWDNSAFKKEVPQSPAQTPKSGASPGGKRKFDEQNSSSPPRDADREFRNSAEPSIGWDGNGARSASQKLSSRVNGDQDEDFAVIDPNLLNNDHTGDVRGVEMQERVNAPLLGQIRRAESDNTSLETIDHMDMDDTVIMEDSIMVEETPAVKQVESRRQGSL